MMTDKQIIKLRLICLYQDTCLFLKEKTRVCEDCVHHKNYWSELLARDQAEKIKSLEQECEELKKGYAELTDIVAPYMDDFTGYNEELGGFDIVLCVKQLLEQLDQLKAENEKLKKIINEAKNSKLDLKSFLVGEAVQNEYEQQLDQLKAENETLFKAIEEVNKINKRLEAEKKELKNKIKELLHDCNSCNFHKYKQTLSEIKEIAQGVRNYLQVPHPKDVRYEMDIILQKISECEGNNDRNNFN